MCVQKRRCVLGVCVGWLLLSQGKFQVANSWHACAAGSVTKGLPPPPLRPSPGNPINCVRQRELVSIDPHSAAFWLADKGHSHVETNARAEQPGGGPVPTNHLFPLPWVWSRFASVLIKQETTKERFCLENLIFHSSFADALPSVPYNPLSSTCEAHSSLWWLTD